MSIIMMLFASTLIIPIGISYASYGNTTGFTPHSTTSSSSNTTMNQTNHTSSNQTMNQTNSSNTNMTMPTLSNSTLSTNQTSPTNSSSVSTNGTQDAQQISDFVHQAVNHFKSQKDETLKAIFACRDQLQQAAPSEIDQVHSDCKIQLNSINAKYQDERNHLHDLIKQYRQSVMVFLMDARGQTVDKVTMNNALASLNSMIHMNMSSGGMTGHVPGLAATVNNTHCVNPPGGPAIC